MCKLHDCVHLPSRNEKALAFVCTEEIILLLNFGDSWERFLRILWTIKRTNKWTLSKSIRHKWQDSNCHILDTLCETQLPWEAYNAGKHGREGKKNLTSIKMDGFTESNNWGTEEPSWGQIIPKRFIWSLIILEKIYVVTKNQQWFDGRKLISHKILYTISTFLTKCNFIYRYIHRNVGT